MQSLQKTWTSDFEKIVRARPEGHVLAVCLHPALDVTVYTKNGTEISRTQTLGGKAINLSRMLHALGAKVTLLAPDDHDGQTSALLSGCGFDCELIKTNLSLRQNYKYVDADGTTREQNGNAGVIFPQHYQQLIHRIVDICRSKKISHVSLCGSFPQGVEKGVYKYVIEQLHTLNIPCVSDASGEALSLAIQAKPLLIKPNVEEFCTSFAQDISLLKTKNDACRAVFSAYSDTSVQILCSMDRHGAIYAGREGVYDACPPLVECVTSFAGAGDTMLAAFIYVHELCNLPIEDALRFACAAATAKVRLPASRLPDLEQIYAEWLLTTVKKGGT
ncbi:MAG: hypothetical protein II330_03995 [Clostridia bacterium]|nr:hypothetical protein [Clostridia bacterium]